MPQMTIIKNYYIPELADLLWPQQPGESPLTIVFFLPLFPSTSNNYLCKLIHNTMRSSPPNTRVASSFNH